MTKKEIINALLSAYWNNYDAILVLDNDTHIELKNKEINYMIKDKLDILKEDGTITSIGAKVIEIFEKNSEIEIDKKKITAYCGKCKIDFKVTDSMKIDYGAFGVPFITCPYCGNEEVEVEGVEPLALTPQNLCYPKHFYKMSEDAVPITKEEIQKWCREASEHLLVNDEEDYFFRASGDTMVIGFNFADEIQIIVAKRYEETSITKEVD